MGINSLVSSVNIPMLIIAVVYILFDVLTGILKGVHCKNLDSTKMREGLFNKVIEIFAIFFGYLVQVTLPTLGINIEMHFGVIFSTYVIIMEACSVLENIGEISPTLGEAMSVIFKKLREKKDDYENGNF